MYKLSHLSNGLKLIAIPQKGTKTATVLVVVGTGSKYEERNNSGISHFLEHLFFKGTKKRPTTLAISSEIDSIGAEFNAFTSKEYTGYWVRGDASKIAVSFDVLSDILLNSKFDMREAEREKGVIIEEMNMHKDDPRSNIDDLFEHLLYGDTPAGREILGTKESVRAMRRVDFLHYVKTQYTAQNTVIVVAGNLSARIERLAEKYFGQAEWMKRGLNFKEKVAVAEIQEKQQTVIGYKKTDQAHLMLGVRAFPYGHKEQAALRVLSVILGGSMSSRLFINLRERRGLAYYIYTNRESYSDSGYLSAQAGVPVDKVKESIQIILAEFAKIKKTLVPAAELKRVKDYLRGKMAIQLEASDEMANYFARIACLSLTTNRLKGRGLSPEDIETPEQMLRRIDRVTAADVRRVAREIFVDEKLNLAIIGPFGNKEDFTALLKII